MPETIRNKCFYLLTILVLSFSSSLNAEETSELNSSIEFQEDDILVSEFHQYLASETDIGWQKKFVSISYKGLIDKFIVRILWIPRDEAPLHHISGPGIIEFIDPSKSTRFTIKCIDLALSMGRLEIDSIEQKRSLLDKSFELQFDPASIKDGFKGDITEPFFFYDVDFDGTDELIVTQFSYGVQNSNMYKAYKLNGSNLVSDTKQITNDRPFSLFNDFTEFNIKDKTIIIGNFFGGGDTQTSIYKKLAKKEFKLISIIKYSFDEKTTFELVDENMKEVKREIVVDSVNIDIE